MGKRFPHVHLEGDKALAERHLRRAQEVELRTTRELAAKMGVETYGRRVLLPSGGYIYTAVSPHGEYITIHEVSQEELVSLVEQEAEEPIILGLYSGFAYKNWMPYTDAPDVTGFTRDQLYPELQDFQPTIVTYERYKADFPLGNTYQPNLRLNIEPAYNSGVADNGTWGPPALTDAPANSIAAQTQIIRPCMFSGLLQQAATLALGLGDLRLPRSTDLADVLQNYSNCSAEYITNCQTYGIQVQYRQQHIKTHGIVQFAPGICWLVECSSTHGILARRLPVLEKRLFGRLTPDEEQMVRQFGGVPVGEAFPSDPTDGISEGWIIQVDASIFSEYYGTTGYAADGYSWCFNPTGSEARTTTYDLDENGLLHSIYWRLQFTASELSVGASLLKLSDEICVEGRAIAKHSTHSEYSAAELGGTYIQPPWGGDAERAGNTTTSGKLNVGFARTNSAQKFSFPGNRPADQVYEDHWDLIPDEMDATIWVGWINGNWSEIHYRSPKIVENYVIFCPAAVEGFADFQARFGSGSVLPSRIAYAEPDDVPAGVTAWTPDTDWTFIPRGWSSELDDFTTEWVTAREYQQTIIFQSGLLNSNRTMYTLGTAMFGSAQPPPYIGAYYAYEYYSIYLHWRRISRGIKGRLYFLTVPFNRNAYFCIDRDDVPAYTQPYAFHTRINAFSEFGYWLSEYSTSAPEQILINDNAPTVTYTRASASDSFSSYDGGTGGPYSSVAIDPLERYDHTLLYKSLPCTAPLDTPPYFYIGYSYQARPDLVGGDTSIPVGHPGGVGGSPFYTIADNGAFIEYSLCQNLALSVANPATPHRDSPITASFSASEYAATVIDRDYTADVYLVADRFPSGPVVELGQFKNDDVRSMENWEMEWWCQVAVAGSEAAIYTDLNNLPAYSPTLNMQDFSYTSAGVHPPLPNTLDTYQYARLTFVGTNGP